MDLANCPNCSRELDGQRNFCPYCGHDLRDKPAPPPKPEPARSEPEPGMAPPPRFAQKPAPVAKARRRIRIIDLRVIFGLFGLIDILLIVAVVVYVFLLKPDGNGPTEIIETICKDVTAEEFVLSAHTAGLRDELTEDTLFGAGTEYLIQDTLIVPQGTRAYIQEGARLIFEEGAALRVEGALFACGSEGQPITFTSEGGEPGSWPGIQFVGAEDNSAIEHALIQFAGDRAVYLEHSMATLIDVEIANGNAFPISTDGNKIPGVKDVRFENMPFNGIEIRGGTVSEAMNITWPNRGVVYVVSGIVEIGENTALGIEPGVIMKFWSASGENLGLRVRGLLTAEDVQFTSVYDNRDDMGGTTYNPAQPAEAGDWSGIAFRQANSNSYLRRVGIYYAGRGNIGSVTMEGTSPELTEVTIADAAWYPLSGDADSFPTLTGIILMDNSPGDAFEVRGNSTINGQRKVTWDILGDGEQIVRVVRGEVSVGPEATLNITPGVVTKFENDSRLVVRGTLIAESGAGDDGRIVFTSLQDSDYAGETVKNNSPQADRSWDGLIFDKSDDSSVLRGTLIRYASVAFNDASPRLIENEIRNSSSAAFWASAMASPTLENNQLIDNDVNGIGIWRQDVTQDQVWPILGDGDDQLVRFLSDRITVIRGATLVIEPGVIVKADDGALLLIEGGLRAEGSETMPVIFTSLRDDEHGGDTNRKIQPARAGDWGGIILQEQADARFGQSTIRYAQNGLDLRRGVSPVVRSILRIEDGRRAVVCNGESVLPAAVAADGNEVNDLECPSQ